MINVDLKMDVRQLNKALDRLSYDMRNKVTVMALNKIVRKANTTMNQSIRKVYRIQRKDVVGKLHITTATKNTLTARISATGKRSFNLIRFIKGGIPDTTPKFTVRGQRRKVRQLKVQVLRGGAAKNIRGAFVGNKGRTVFRRVDPNNNKSRIEAVSTVGVSQMFNTKRVQKPVLARIRKEFPIEFERASKQALRRFNKRQGNR